MESKAYIIRYRIRNNIQDLPLYYPAEISDVYFGEQGHPTGPIQGIIYGALSERIS